MKAFKPVACAAALTISLGLALASARPTTAIADPASTVRTDKGLISGAAGRDPTISVFKGIPFAAAPIGDQRWRAPAPIAPWTGVRRADRFGDICPQSQRGTRVPMSEDCLTLNVWTKAHGAQRRPVFVWIYGGRFTGGAGSDPNFDGEGLARKGLVVVTLNYRTGVFGFLATPELSREGGHGASGNYGLLDQIAALKWVQRNIAAFGGDPTRITIAGQSAGAASVLMLVNSPLAKGLFHRAIAESGARYPNDPEISGLATSWRIKADAEAAGVTWAGEHGATTVAQLRALSVDQLLVGNNANDTIYGHPPLFRPVVDGWVVPRTYAQTLAGGFQSDVPIITGNNLDESGAEPQNKPTLAAFIAAVRAKYGPMADRFLALYPAADDAAADQARKLSARESTRTSTFLWARSWRSKAKSPAYSYYWDHTPPGPEGARRGAYHGSEISYGFDNLDATDLPWTDADRRIADIMSSYWVNFATRGDPNGPGLPRWNSTASGAPVTMELGDRFGPLPIANPARAKLFTDFYATQRTW